MGSKIRTVYHWGLNKGFNSKFPECYWMSQKTPEKGQRGVTVMLWVKQPNLNSLNHII